MTVCLQMRCLMMLSRTTDPLQAARYQMIMMFLIAATTGLGSTSAVYAATATIVDTEHRIRPERLRPRGSRGAKLADKLQDIIVGVRGFRTKVPSVWMRRWPAPDLFLNALLHLSGPVLRRVTHLAALKVSNNPAESSAPAA